MATESKRDERDTRNIVNIARHIIASEPPSLGPTTQRRLAQEVVYLDSDLDAAQKKLTRVEARLAELIRFHDHAATYEQGAYQVMHETFANELRKALAEPSEQAACGIPCGGKDEPCILTKGHPYWHSHILPVAPPTPAATMGDFNNRLLRLEGIVKAIIEAVRGDQ